MKKIISILLIMTAVVAMAFMTKIPTVDAESTNVFDATKIQTSAVHIFSYNDPSLPTGFYTISITNSTLDEQHREMAYWKDYSTITNDEDGTFPVAEWISGGAVTYPITVTESGTTIVIHDLYVTDGHFVIEFLEDQGEWNYGLIRSELTAANVSITFTEIDDVEPEFTYSNLQVDAKYYDLPTAAEIQAELSATDDQDGDVTSRIEIYQDSYTGTDQEVGGDYFIMFRVSDLSGNYAYLRVDVEIIDDRAPYIVYDGTTYQSSATIVLDPWYNDDDETEQITLDELAELFDIIDEYYGPNTYDEESGWKYNITPNVYMYGTWDPYMGEYEFYTNPGHYTLHLEIQDASGNVCDIYFDVTVLANDAPEISGPASLTIEITNFTIAGILAQYSATDTEDGTAAVVVDASNTWNYGTPTLGSNFALTLSATDSLGKTTLMTIPVTVRDTTLPVFKINNIAVTTYAHTVLMSATESLQALIDSIVVTDAYYGTLTASKVVPAFPSFTTPGVTVLTITCTDASGNVGSLAITVTVSDDVLPVVSGPIKVVKGKTATMTLSEITARLSAVDNVSGSLSIVLVSDGYTGHATEIGSYLVRYKATDAAGNIKYHDVRVWVVDNVAPVWVIDDYFINLGMNESMTRTELVALLQASGMLATDLSYTVTFITDEYTGSEDIAGAHSVVIRVTYEDGSEDEISLQLTVPEDEDDDIIVVTPDEPTTGLQRAWRWLTGFVADTWDVVVGAWNWVKGAAVWTKDHIIIPVWNFLFVKDVTTTIPPVEEITTTTASA
ncbi:MAG: hypothetical protein WC509_02130 [Candidatus Izemoplasmatales bacterium]